MAVPLEQFVKQLEDTGIVPANTLQDFLPPKSEPKDAEDLARELVRQKKLTTFQAEEFHKGNGRSLVLDNYVLLEKIGQGGMGMVFKAEHRRMHRIVAVKVLPISMLKNAATVARFQREVRAAAAINHPHIVTAFDAGQDGGVHFLVMEYVEGSDLAALVKKNGPFPVERAVNFILQAAKGLEAAHAQGITHRDIKPANLLVDQEGLLKILDMGLARLSVDGDPSQHAELTSTGAIMGTVDYMSPEQALDTKTADARTDIYSLGCSLFFLLTGRAAYLGDSMMQKLMAHREEPIPSLRAFRPEVSEQVEVVFTRMVAKNVEDRYQTMSEVIANLERCSAGPAAAFDTRQLFGASTNAGLSDFLKDLPDSPVTPVRSRKSGSLFGEKRKPLVLVSGILGALLLAGLIFGLTTKTGAPPVTVKQPDASAPANGDAPAQGNGNLANSDEDVADSGTETDESSKAWERPAFQKWMKQVASLAPHKQVDAVVRKLQELNPGFDGKVTPKTEVSVVEGVEVGVVTELVFVTNEVSDISPVRALSGLKTLQINCHGHDRGKVSDVSPLEGMRLTHLYLHQNPVSDLSPLAGMPLTTLTCDFAPVSDTSPLKGMPLTELWLGRTEVSDLSPLTGMPLNTLSCGNNVSDLSPLKGMMSLRVLYLNETQVTDLSPLRGLSLSHLTTYWTKVSDLTPLRGMPLEVLICEYSRVTDLSPLKETPLVHLQYPVVPARDGDILRSIKTLQAINGNSPAEFWKVVAEKQAAFEAWTKQVAAMPAAKQVDAVSRKLRELNREFDGKVTSTIENGDVVGLQFSTNFVTDISPVRALARLQRLDCSGRRPEAGRLQNLWPLAGMPLVALSIATTNVFDLAPLAGMPLTDLDIQGTDVSDLSPLQSVKLTTLNCGITKVTDLAPLQGMKLTTLNCGITKVGDLSPLKDMPLADLNCGGTEVSDLSSLTGMPLTSLQCWGTRVTELSPLKNLLLKTLRCDFEAKRDAALLRSLKTLQTINDKPAAEFWREVEAQQSGKKP